MDKGAARSAIFFANRLENIDRFRRLIQDDNLVANVARNAIDIACLERLFLAADDEDCPTRQEHVNLPMRMGMFLHSRVRYWIDWRHHQPGERACANLHTRENP